MLILGGLGCSTDLLSHHVLQSSVPESQGNTSVDYTIQKGPVTPLTFTFPTGPLHNISKVPGHHQEWYHPWNHKPSNLALTAISYLSYNSFYLIFTCTRRGDSSESRWSFPVRQAESRVGEVRVEQRNLKIYIWSLSSSWHRAPKSLGIFRQEFEEILRLHLVEFMWKK